MNDTELNSNISNWVYGFAEKKEVFTSTFDTWNAEKLQVPGWVDKYMRAEFVTKQNPKVTHHVRANIHPKSQCSDDIINGIKIVKSMEHIIHQKNVLIHDNSYFQCNKSDSQACHS